MSGEPASPAFREIVVDVAKLRDYCLSPFHPRGRHKARVFQSRLGLTAADAELLRNALLAAVRNHPQALLHITTDLHGRRYALAFELSAPAGTATIRSTWIVLTGQDVLRFVTCYVP